MKIIFYLVFLLTSITAISQNLNLGLRAYYPFTGTANDASGFGNHPSFNNAALTADRFGTANSAYHFNGTNSYMQIPSSSSLNVGTAVSLCVWIKPTGFYMGTCHGNSILMKGNAASPSFFDSYLLRYDDGYYTGGANCGNAFVDAAHENFYGSFPATLSAYTPYVQTGQWTSLVYTYDGATINLYVNCILRKTVSYTGYNFTNTFDLFLGKLNNSNYPYWLNADLDEVRIYNRALTPAEVEVYGDCRLAPVKITDFTAAVINKKAIQVLWRTEEESEIKDYTIERSRTGVDFLPVGSIISTDSPTANAYSYTDYSALPNILYYYRLRVNSLSGKTEYTPVKSAKIERKDFYTVIYPNPTIGIVKIIFTNYNDISGVTVSNNLGEVVMVQAISSIPSNTVELNMSNLPAGPYWLSVRNNGKVYTEKIIKH